MSDVTHIRLDTNVRAVAPINGIWMIDKAAQQAKIDYLESATPADIAAGDAVLTAFDWSEAADTSFLAQQATDVAIAALDRGTTINGIAVDRVVVALALVMLDEINNIRTNISAATLVPRTQAQLMGAVKAKLNTLPK